VEVGGRIRLILEATLLLLYVVRKTGNGHGDLIDNELATVTYSLSATLLCVSQFNLKV